MFSLFLGEERWGGALSLHPTSSSSFQALSQGRWRAHVLSSCRSERGLASPLALMDYLAGYRISDSKSLLIRSSRALHGNLTPMMLNSCASVPLQGALSSSGWVCRNFSLHWHSQISAGASGLVFCPSPSQDAMAFQSDWLSSTLGTFLLLILLVFPSPVFCFVILKILSGGFWSTWVKLPYLICPKFIHIFVYILCLLETSLLSLPALHWIFIFEITFQISRTLAYSPAVSFFVFFRESCSCCGCGVTMSLFQQYYGFQRFLPALKH